MAHLGEMELILIASISLLTSGYKFAKLLLV
jgi:hypothetical protein